MEQIYEKIKNMTNKEAAEILKQSIAWLSLARGNGKTAQLLRYNVAMHKAIQALENTPDEEIQCITVPENEIVIDRDLPDGKCEHIFYKKEE